MSKAFVDRIWRVNLSLCIFQRFANSHFACDFSLNFAFSTMILALFATSAVKVVGCKTLSLLEELCKITNRCRKNRLQTLNKNIIQKA